MPPSVPPVPPNDPPGRKSPQPPRQPPPAQRPPYGVAPLPFLPFDRRGGPAAPGWWGSLTREITAFQWGCKRNELTAGRDMGQLSTCCPEPGGVCRTSGSLEHVRCPLGCCLLVLCPPGCCLLELCPPRCSSPDALSPRVLFPGAVSHRVLSPGALSPRVLSPGALSPRVLIS